MSPTIVLITGANQGLGYFTALQLAQQPGYHIIIGSRDASKGADAVEKIKSDGAQSAVETIQLDVDSDASIDAAVKTVKEKFGKLDVLVNNAAHSTDREFASKSISLRENMSRTYATNVFGAAYLSEASLPLLRESSFPRIVNVSSGLGSATYMSDMDGPYASARLLAYNTSKSALNGVTTHYAYILRQQNPSSLVVCLCPGYNATNLNGYSGTQDPKIGGSGIVAAITQGPGTAWKTGEFRNQFGKVVPW